MLSMLLLLTVSSLLHLGNLQQIITESKSTIPVVASGSYRFTNVSAELAYVFQLPKNFSYFSIKAEVKVPDPSWFYEKSYQSKLLFYESSVPYIYTGPGKTYVLKIYNDPSDVSNDSFSTRKAGWYLIVHFMPSYNFVISGDLLNLTVTAANAPDKNGRCSKDTFKCSTSADLCLTQVALHDGRRNCENGYDEEPSSKFHNVTSDFYPFSNVSKSQLYVFQLPSNFNFFFIKAVVKMPNETWNNVKLHKSKLIIMASRVPFISTDNAKTNVLKVYKNASPASTDSFRTTKARWYLLVNFRTSYNVRTGRIFLNLTLTAANVPNKDGVCPKGTFNCTPWAALCLTRTALCDGVRNCENGYDEQMCESSSTINHVFFGIVTIVIPITILFRFKKRLKKLFKKRNSLTLECEETMMRLTLECEETMMRHTFEEHDETTPFIPKGKSIHSLGRAISLGSVYDICQDAVIDRHLIWSEEEIRNNAVLNEINSITTDIELVSSDTLSERLSALKLNAATQGLSVISGLVRNRGGSLNYINDVKPTNSIRIVLNHSLVIRSEDMKLEPTYFQKEEPGTYGVGGITHGARVLFVFDFIPGIQFEEAASFQRTMESLTETFFKNSESQPSVAETEMMKKISCRVYSDIELTSSPKTMYEAINVFKDMLNTVNNEKITCIQTQVKLYSLPNVDSEKVIDETTSNRILEILDSADQSPRKSKARLDDKSIKDDEIDQIQILFREKVMKVLPAVRRGYKDVKKFFKKVKEVFLACKRRKELSEALENALEGTKVTQDVNAHMMCYRHVFCCSIKTLKKTNGFLKDFKTFLNDEHDEVVDKYLDDNCWNPTCLNPKKVSSSNEMLTKFRLLEQANGERQNVAFIVTTEMVSCDEEVGPVISHFKAGFLDREFQVPDAPGKPSISEVTNRSVTLRWSPPKTGADLVKMYHVQFRQFECDEEWKEANNNGNKPFCTVDGLQEGCYNFRVYAELDWGVSLCSVISDAIYIKTLTQRPINDAVGNTSKPPLRDVPVKDKDDDGTMTRIYEFGEQHYTECCSEKTILILGATGSGKSTIFNAMAKYLLKTVWKDPEFRIVKFKDDKTYQDQWITTYKIHAGDSGLHYCLNIIDTPGFSDTRGNETDKQLVERIKHIFQTDIVTIDAVCVVTQAPFKRLTPEKSYINESVLGVFGNDINENIFWFITRVESTTPPVLEGFCPHADRFVFNISELDKDISDPTSVYSPDMGSESFDQFFNKLSNIKPKSLQLGEELLRERESLGTMMANQGIQHP